MIEVAAAVIFSGNKVLLASRPVDKPPAGWEFPGGKLEPGESIFEAVKRELMEELQLPVIPEKVLHVQESSSLILYFVSASIKGDVLPVAQENQEFRWVELAGQAPEGLLANDLKFWQMITAKEY